MGFFDKLFGQQNTEELRPEAPKTERNTCDFCGKPLHVRRGIRTSNDAKEYEEIVKEMATRKCICPTCGSVFCLFCAYTEGKRRGTRDSHCPKCGRSGILDQLR